MMVIIDQELRRRLAGGERSGPAQANFRTAESEAPEHSESASGLADLVGRLNSSNESVRVNAEDELNGLVYDEHAQALAGYFEQEYENVLSGGGSREVQLTLSGETVILTISRLSTPRTTTKCPEESPLIAGPTSITTRKHLEPPDFAPALGESFPMFGGAGGPGVRAEADRDAVYYTEAEQTVNILPPKIIVPDEAIPTRYDISGEFESSWGGHLLKIDLVTGDVNPYGGSADAGQPYLVFRGLTEHTSMTEYIWNHRPPWWPPTSYHVEGVNQPVLICPMIRTLETLADPWTPADSAGILARMVPGSEWRGGSEVSMADAYLDTERFIRQSDNRVLSWQTEDLALYVPVPQCAEGLRVGYALIGWDAWMSIRTAEAAGGTSIGETVYVDDYYSRIEPRFAAWWGEKAATIGQVLESVMIPWEPETRTTYSYSVYVDGAEIIGEGDGSPPPVEERPDPVPISGNCHAGLGAPSGCNIITPVPDGPLPLPGDNIVFEPPDPSGEIPPFEMPIMQITVPNTPPYPCHLPDMGNFDACPPRPGHAGALPGAMDASGKPIPGAASITTGGPSTRRDTFRKKRCYGSKPGYRDLTAAQAIRELGAELDLDEDTLLFEEPCNKKFEKCFPKNSSKFDAIWWIADNICGHEPIDNGDGTIIIGPVKPLDRTWRFHEDVDLFTLERNYSALDVYHAVEVYWPGTRRQSVIAFVNGPFDTPEDEVLRIPVGLDVGRGEAADIAGREAAKSRRSALSVKVAVPYDRRRKLRHQSVVERPTRGFEERLMITAMEPSFAPEGNLHILTLSLP